MTIEAICISIVICLTNIVFYICVKQISKSQDFLGLFIFHKTFPGLKNTILKYHDFSQVFINLLKFKTGNKCLFAIIQKQSKLIQKWHVLIQIYNKIMQNIQFLFMHTIKIILNKKKM